MLHVFYTTKKDLDKVGVSVANQRVRDVNEYK